MAIACNDINILVVDDEQSILDFIQMGLEAEGFKVYTALDGISAVELATEINPPIVILDIMLPDMNGFEVCREIKRYVNTSIIMLTAKDEIDDKVLGLNTGADDYMVKPFSFKELLARINARLRSSYSLRYNVQYIGIFKIDDSTHEISMDEKLLALSPTEYNLLRYLLINNGIVLSKQSILDNVWEDDFEGDENIVEVYIRYLRDKIGDKSHSIIKTIRGAGYKVVL
ncbi:response regulator transcription factor [Clostridium oryzae]|uniref:Stage 0 sporulation protein A homolog n=1 Tax=Clostridium oryzae TaxID=1450648 RepID=A0A1V4IS53_9CLOT|nr:response regulator transcription factor [Clostridium oryzae]OPJ62756.1 transcriptional regulatory protein YycF [Clostridium oryzae]